MFLEFGGKETATIAPDTGHLSMLSHLSDVADLILAAAGQGKQR